MWRRRRVWLDEVERDALSRATSLPAGLLSEVKKACLFLDRPGLHGQSGIRPGNPQLNDRHERMHLTSKLETTKPAGGNFLQQQARLRPHVVGRRSLACQEGQGTISIQRLERARQYLAGFETLENFGRGAFVRAIPAEVKAYATQQYARPNLGYAEGERGQLDRLVNPPPKKRRR
jgi:hypothetical protein